MQIGTRRMGAMPPCNSSEDPCIFKSGAHNRSRLTLAEYDLRVGQLMCRRAQEAPGPIKDRPVFEIVPRTTRASLGAGAVRYTFTVADLHGLPPAGLPAHPSSSSR